MICEQTSTNPDRDGLWFWWDVSDSLIRVKHPFYHDAFFPLFEQMEEAKRRELEIAENFVMGPAVRKAMRECCYASRRL